MSPNTRRPDNPAVDDLIRRRQDTDLQIMDLLNQRARLALALSAQGGGEAEPLPGQAAWEGVAAANRGPLPDQAARDIFRELISACAGLASPTRVAFVGPEMSGGHQAVLAHFGRSAQPAPTATVADVFGEVERGGASVGVVPVENSAEGAVGETLDQLITTSLAVVSEICLPLNQALVGSGPLEEVIEVHGHHRVLARSRVWLARNLPSVRLVEAANTKEALALAALPGMAAVVGEVAARESGLDVLRGGVQDLAHNTARFLVLGAQSPPPCGTDKTSLVFATEHTPGALYRCLGALSEAGLDLSRLESRPNREEPWEYFFFADLAGHREDASVAQAIEVLERRARWVKVLGSYPAAVLLRQA